MKQKTQNNKALLICATLEICVILSTSLAIYGLVLINKYEKQHENIPISHAAKTEESYDAADMVNISKIRIENILLMLKLNKTKNNNEALLEWAESEIKCLNGARQEMGNIPKKYINSYVSPSETFSMSPVIEYGDTIYYYNINSLEEIHVCDIVAYHSPHGYFLHRIIGMNGTRYIMKGDGNTEKDAYQPVFENITFKVVGVMWG